MFPFTRPLIPEDGALSSRGVNTVELHLSRLIGTVSRPDVQTIWIIGFFFENRPHWQIEVGKISTNSDFTTHIYLPINKI